MVMSRPAWIPPGEFVIVWFIADRSFLSGRDRAPFLVDPCERCVSDNSFVGVTDRGEGKIDGADADGEADSAELT